MLQYEISACSVWWHQDSPDTRYFNSVAEQTSYFETLAGGNYTPLANFNMGDNVETVVIYRDTSGRDAETLISCNYAIVRKTTTDDTGAKSYSYRYFFARFSQDSANQMRAVLSLDDIQTNFFKNFDVIKSTPCWVNRAHLNRFVESGTAGSVTFDATPTSKLFSNDNIKLPKRLISRERIKQETIIYIRSGSSFSPLDISQFLEDNVAAWIYVFYSSEEDAKLKYIDQGFYKKEDLGTPDSLFSPKYSCVCAPLYKKGANKIFVRAESSAGVYTDYELSINGILGFFKDSAQVYTYTISQVSPFGSEQAGSHYAAQGEIPERGWFFSGNNLYASSTFGTYNYKIEDTTEEGTYIFTGFKNGSYDLSSEGFSEEILNASAMALYGVPIKRTSKPITVNDLSFSKSSIIGAERSKEWNPQLYGQNARELTITDGVSSGFSYDLQKIGNISELSFDMYCTISSDISRFYVTISKDDLTDENIYIPETTENYTGLIGSFDGTLPFTVDLLDQFLANNKNFYLQKELGYNKQYVDQAFQAASSLFNSTSKGFASGGPFGALAAGASSVVNSAISFGKTAVDIQYDKINTRLSLDNMRNAKDALQGANGSAILNVPVSPMGFYVEIYEALDTEMAQVDDVQYKFGFAYNRLDTIEPYINTRKYFNYISADFDFINAPLSAFEEERLKARLRDVRFWYSDNVQYTLENYETWLED